MANGQVQKWMRPCQARNTMAMMIYKITNTVNNKVYIGQTIRTLESRFARHIDDAIKNPHTLNKFHRAINKYGKDKFKIELIDEANTQDELNKKEKYWIKQYDSVKNGYNTAEGGEGGNTYKGRTKKQMNITKAKISKANLGRNNGMSNQIKAKNVKTNKEYFFDTLGACLKFLGVANKGIVMNRANGNCNTLWRNEWMFAYEDKEYADFREFHYDPSCRKGTKVVLIKDNEKFMFNSKNKACEFLNVGKMPLMNGMVVNGYSIEIP